MASDDREKLYITELNLNCTRLKIISAWHNYNNLIHNIIIIYKSNAIKQTNSNEGPLSTEYHINPNHNPSNLT